MMWTRGWAARLGWPWERERSRRIVLTVAMLAGGVLTPLLFVPPAAAMAAGCEIPQKGTGSSTSAAADEAAVIEIADDETPAGVKATPAAARTDPQALLNSELTAVSEALADCLTAGDVQQVVKLAGERYLGQLFGSSVPMSAEEFVTLASPLTPVPTHVVSLAAVTAVDRNQATATVTHVVGNQLIQAEWLFERAPRGERAAGENQWRIVAERQLPVESPRGAETIDVRIAENAFALDRQTVSGPDVVLRGENAADMDHEILVLRYASGYTSTDLLRAAGPDLPAEVTYIGEIPVRAGSTRDLVLVDLDPGTYTIVCLFPDPSGTPYLAYGMEATFTVE